MKRHNLARIFILASMITTSFSCSENKQLNQSSSEDLPTISEEEVQITKVATLAVINNTEGEGKKIKFGDRVRMKVIVMDKFENPIGRSKIVTTRIGSGSAIAGVERAAVGMNVGGKRKVFIPSRLAYGSVGVRSMVSPNQDLVVAIDLLGIAGNKI